METKTLQLTTQEADQLIALLDVANKNLGLQGSRACVYFHTKIIEAFKNQEKELEETAGEV